MSSNYSTSDVTTSVIEKRYEIPDEILYPITIKANQSKKYYIIIFFVILFIIIIATIILYFALKKDEKHEKDKDKP